MNHLQYLSVLLLFLCFSCKNRDHSTTQEKNTATQDTITTFVLPEIPVMLTLPEQRAEFLVKHYWDNVNFADTNYIHHPDITEQAWADYCDLLNHVSLADAQKDVKATMLRAEVNKKVYQYITELADKYLYDPNSPMRNEEFYIPVLEAMVTSSVLDETEKIRPQARLELARKNRAGTKALDFGYTLASGAKGHLYQLSADYILLFINNPGCHSCAEMIENIKESQLINRLIDEKKLILLSFYPDEDIDEWKNHLYDFPKKWINSYDTQQEMKNKNLYDLKAIPTLYLLGRDKTVLLKDAPLSTIIKYLE